MSNTWGEQVRLSIFGESHGNAIGIVVGGLPPGEEIDLDALERDMRRRAPGRDAFSTPRSESDSVELLSGLLDGKTTGAPVCGVIRNENARSRDYDTRLRPGHADMTALLKYAGHADMRGGGHFSGRLTAPLVFAGSLAKQILLRRGVHVHARILRIGGVADESACESREAFRHAAAKPFPVCGDAAGEQMQAAILRAKEQSDSVGGVVECAAFGVPAGLGEPFFASMESAIASMLFSVPAVKGVEFGDGFALAGMAGSEANDEILLAENGLATRTNHNGGILGGITNGMPLIVRAAIKPTPSIAKIQRTVDAATMRPVELAITGRHDPCIVPRAVPVVEAGVALCILDRLAASKGY